MKRFMSGSWIPANNVNCVRNFGVSVFQMSREA